MDLVKLMSQKRMEMNYLNKEIPKKNFYDDEG